MTVQLDSTLEKLAAQWRAETQHLSDFDRIVSHPAYLRMIGMGSDALPFILEELEREIGFWFPALEAITGQSPVPKNARVSMTEMAEAWLDWGREHGYLS